jgi:hypothetical protein
MTDEDFRVCHYTGTQGLISILTTHTLRATSAAFMNDANEMRTGAAAFSELLESRRHALNADEIEHVEQSGLLSVSGAFRNFLLSAADDPDNLTLWRNYGVSQVAYSIELDPRAPLVPLAKSKQDKHPSPPPGFYDREMDTDPATGESFPVDADPDWVAAFGGAWQRVSYVEDFSNPTIVAHFDDMIDKFRRRGKGGIWIPAYAVGNSLLDFIKDAGFEDEREVRSVHWVNPWWKFVEYRETKFGVAPFISLTTPGSETTEWAATANKLPIVSVTIGPNATDAAEKALRALLDQWGYGDAKISRSKTPYR